MGSGLSSATEEGMGQPSAQNEAQRRYHQREIEVPAAGGADDGIEQRLPWSAIIANSTLTRSIEIAPAQKTAAAKRAAKPTSPASAAASGVSGNAGHTCPREGSSALTQARRRKPWHATKMAAWLGEGSIARVDGYALIGRSHQPCGAINVGAESASAVSKQAVPPRWSAAPDWRDGGERWSMKASNGRFKRRTKK